MGYWWATTPTGSSGRDDRIFGLDDADSLDGGPEKGNAANCETLVAIP